MKKFIAFGCKAKSSTHSYIHYAYQKAFESLGWESHWVDNNDTENIDFSNSLILTLGGWDQNIPLRKDCKYILHNCNMDKYRSVVDNAIVLQVFTKDVFTRDVEKIDDCIYYQKDKNFGAPVIYQPWATDLLPNEIEEKKNLNFGTDKKVLWVGSIWNSAGQGNTEEISKLKLALEKRGLEFDRVETDYHNNKEIINKSFISPSLQGEWQCDVGYIPCRIFKNISYGEFGITNSKWVNELFKEQLVFDEDIDKMIEKALLKRESITLEEINSQIRLVKEKHTYINRIENILKVI